MFVRPRLNPSAIIVSAIVYFAIDTAWYSFFLKQWVTGIGRNMAWLHGTGGNLPLACAIALASAAVLAAVLAWCIQVTGEQTPLRGMEVAVVLWLGFVLTTWTSEYVFEQRSIEALAITAGFPLVGMIAQGAILGAWKSKHTHRWRRRDTTPAHVS